MALPLSTGAPWTFLGHHLRPSKCCSQTIFSATLSLKMNHSTWSLPTKLHDCFDSKYERRTLFTQGHPQSPLFTPHPKMACISSKLSYCLFKLAWPDFTPPPTPPVIFERTSLVFSATVSTFWVWTVSYPTYIYPSAFFITPRAPAYWPVDGKPFFFLLSTWICWIKQFKVEHSLPIGCLKMTTWTFLFLIHSKSGKMPAILTLLNI